MTVQHASGYCRACGRRAAIHRPGTNHVLHLLLTLFSFGLWLPLWVLGSIQFGGWRCVACGMKASKSFGR